MKKFRIGLSFIIFVCLLCSCQKEQINDQLVIPHFHSIGEVVTTKGLSTDYSITKEMVESYIKSDSKHKKILSLESYPSAESPTLYVVNFEEGWAIYPTDSRFGITLANSPYGNLDIYDKSHSPGFRLLIEDYHNQIAHFHGQPMSVFDESSVRFWNNFRAEKVAYMDVIDNAQLTRSAAEGMPWFIVDAGTSTMDSVMVDTWHLVGTEWGQEAPWNSKMPVVYDQRCVTGCAPLAVAQVLKYFNESTSAPSGLYHSLSEISRHYHSSYPYADYVSVTLDRGNYTANSPRWNQMARFSSYGSAASHDYASELILDIGVRLSTRYGLSASGIAVDPSNNFFDISPANLSYSWSTYTNQMVDIVIGNLLDMKPIIITAAESRDVHSIHTWIIDGTYSSRIFYQHDYELWPISMLPPDANVLGMIYESDLASQEPDYFPGKVVHVRDDYADARRYYMNFGDEGGHKWSLFSIWPNYSWDTYDIKKAVHYNLAPGELLIQ